MASLDLDRIFSLMIADVRRSFMRLFPLFLAIGVVTNLANSWLLESVENSTGYVAFGLLCIMIALAIFFVSIEVLLASQAQAPESSLDYAVAVGQSLRRLPLLLAVFAGYYLAVMAGMLLLIIPGLILMVTLGYVWFFVLLDELGLIASFRGSFRIVWGNAWQVVGANFFIFLGYMISAGILFFLLPGSPDELIEVLAGDYAITDWRRWMFDLLAVAWMIVYLFLNLHLFAELKRLKVESAPADPATVSA